MKLKFRIISYTKAGTIQKKVFHALKFYCQQTNSKALGNKVMV